MSDFQYLDKVKKGDLIHISRINPELEECDDNGYKLLQDVLHQTCTVMGTSVHADLCQEEGEQYGDFGILISHPYLRGHNGQGTCPQDNCFWINEYYATFTIGDNSFDTEGAFNSLYEQEEDEFGWVTDLGMPENIDDSKLRNLTNYKLVPLTVEDLSPGLFIKRKNGKFLYELGEATVENYMKDGVEYRNEGAPGFMLKNLSNGKLYFTKTKHILREFFAIRPRD